MNQAEYFQAHAVDGVLTDAQTAQMLNLPEGDIEFTPSSKSGEPEPTPAPTPAPQTVEPTPAPTPAPTPEPVILAADGLHTIGYEKLVEARDEAKAAKARADAAEAELAALKGAAPAPTPGPTPAPTAAPAAAEDKPDFGDYSDEALAAGLEKWVEKRVAARVDEVVAQKLGPLEERQQKDAIEAHFKPIYEKHPNLDAMLESAELESWIKAQPSYAQAGIRDVLAKGTSDQVIELFDSFTKATGKTATPPPPAASPAPAGDARAAAAKAIADAAAKPPNSLSEIPGTSGPHDEAAAMLELSPTALLSRFAGKSPEQIEALMNKAL